MPPDGARRRATEQTRRRVVRSARAVFAAQGYGGASIRRIAADAGVTPMALYTYAASKAELFQLVYEDSITRIYASYAEVVAGKETLLAEVEAVLERGGQLLDDDPDLLRFLMRVATDHQHEDLDRLELITSAYASFFHDLADRAVARGEIGRGDRLRVISFVTMLLWGITTTASIDPAGVGAAVATATWAAQGRLTPDDRPA